MENDILKETQHEMISEFSPLHCVIIVIPWIYRKKKPFHFFFKRNCKIWSIIFSCFPHFHFKLSFYFYSLFNSFSVL